MIDVQHRDGAARRATWTPAAHRALVTPLLLHVDTERFPAPSSAAIVIAARRPASGAPWIQDLGSRFSPVPRDPAAFLHVEPDLPYPPSAGDDLLAAGETESRAAIVGGDAHVTLTPAWPPEAASELVALGGARALVENPYAMARRLTSVREAIGPSRLLYAPGCGRPDEIALLAYAGVDVFDTASAALAASRGELLEPEGAFRAADLAATGLAPPLDRAEAFARNVAAAEGEVARVHRAIALGRLRELVEQRARARPELAAHLRRFDKECYDFFEARAPLVRAGPLYATSKESIERVEIERYRRRIESRYAKPESARVLLVLPCSARKPYSESKTHRILDRVLDGVRNRAAVHEVVLTSPMGVVPRELERVYPAAHYDLPVTGHWDEDEKAMVRGAFTALVSRSKYDAVVVHLDEVEMEIVAPVLGDFRYTADGDPLAAKSLDQLRETLRAATDATPRVPWGRRTADDLAAIARWQFGTDAALALASNTVARGKWPYLKLLDAESGVQVAMTTPERGLLSLTLEGGRRLLEAGCYRVEIEDFRPKGTVFAVGVTAADAEIRPEDDVVLHHRGALKGVGRAAIAGPEMARLRRGAAVHVRHAA